VSNFLRTSHYTDNTRERREIVFWANVGIYVGIYGLLYALLSVKISAITPISKRHPELDQL
jgi:uncharacterized membrane protein